MLFRPLILKFRYGHVDPIPGGYAGRRKAVARPTGLLRQLFFNNMNIFGLSTMVHVMDELGQPVCWRADIFQKINYANLEQSKK